MENNVTIPYKQYRNYFMGFTILLILLNIGDIVTTIMVLNAGGVEGNPLARMMFANVGYGISSLLKMVMCMAVIILCAMIVKKKNYIAGIATLVFINGLTFAVVYGNLLVLLHYVFDITV